MKNIIRYAVIFLFVFVPLPVAVMAETGTTTAQQQMIHQWRQSSQLQQDIVALGTTPVTAIAMPVLFGVAPSNLTPNFGDPRDNGTRTHEGEDIMAVKGTPIVSPTAAVVIRITTDLTSSEGNAVYTANPGGETFVYYHLDRIGEGVVAGLVIRQGSLIGYVGNTGNAAGGSAHLHFEVHNSAGTPTDPFPRLTAEFTPAQKISFLTTILMQTSEPITLSQFLVTNFRSTFVADVQGGIILPSLIANAITIAPALPSITDAGCLPGNNFSTTTGHSCSSVATSANSSLYRNLSIGMSGNDVRILQVWLNAHGYVLALSGPGSSGNETTTFGALTRAELAKFQADAGIIPALGYFGPITRSYLSLHF